MTAPNHIVGGLTFTGIFAAFTDVNILEKPSYLVITIFAALLPDIDHTKSILGKVFFPLARWINRKYGHRTITHTILALAIGTIITSILETNFGTDGNYSKLFFLAYLSHLIFDMMTVQGVPLFYPFSRNPCVLPANPEKRFRTGNLRTETMIFSFFTLSAVFCYPLMKNGFWMQYNRQFGTLTHLAKQYKITENVLEVEFSYREGSD
jgi:inner membrane protein